MRVAVTGGAGFIGSNLVDRLLRDGHDVLVIDNLNTGKRDNLRDAEATGRCVFTHADITEASSSAAVIDYRPEVIFHLAAQADVRVSVAQPEFDARVNVLGTLRILEAAQHAGTRRFVAAASGGTLYGEVDESLLPIVETTTWAPLSPYGISKMAMIHYLKSATAVHGIETTSLALGNVYGPRQDPHGEAGVVAIFCNLFAERTPSTIFGTGEQTRDFVYVDDVVDAFARAGERTGTGELINIGTGVETSVNAIHNDLRAISGYDEEPVRRPARPGEVDRSVLNVTRASVLLGWQPHVAMFEGLQRTWDWTQHSSR